mgnify:CR=1 FL=1
MILEEIAARTVQRVAEEKAAVPLSEMKKRAEALDANTGFPFREALSGDEISFICEVKRASPSKGLIAPDFPYLDIARDYERAVRRFPALPSRSGSRAGTSTSLKFQTR